MEERIILAPGANGTELLRSLSKYGHNTIGLRIVGAAGLADMMLTGHGEAYLKQFISFREQTALVFSFLNEIGYFKNASYTDAENVAASLNVLRTLIVDEEEINIHRILSKGEFPEKNEALLEVFDILYTQTKENGKNYYYFRRQLWLRRE